MKNATVGLVLMLSVYAILYTVNPELTILDPVSLQVVQEFPMTVTLKRRTSIQTKAEISQTMQRRARKP